MTIPAGTKFHGVDTSQDTINRGSTLANGWRDAYTIEDIIAYFSANILTLQPVIQTASTALTQETVTSDVPIQIEFGPGQGSAGTPVQVDALGTITFNQAGTYFVRLTFLFERTGNNNSGELVQHLRITKDGIQVGSTQTFELKETGITLPYNTTITYTATAGDEIKVELVEDSTSHPNAQGGLVSFITSTTGWGDSPTASLNIQRVLLS
tara:strand:+ start:2888 stop:3517 length:630 start_codon:yes stop_codon:yes gene_type:complete